MGPKYTLESYLGPYLRKKRSILYITTPRFPPPAFSNRETIHTEIFVIHVFSYSILCDEHDKIRTAGILPVQALSSTFVYFIILHRQQLYQNIRKRV